jgi:hypothetical protein
MAITVIGFFRERSEAENAVKQLGQSGYYRNDIDISYGSFVTSESTSISDSTYRSNDNTEDDSRTVVDNNLNDENTYRDDRSKDRKGNAITRFFNSLFGDNSDDAKKYSAVSQRADSIVTVHAGNSEQAEEAANILDASGAMDIDEGDLISDTYHNVSDTYHNIDSNYNVDSNTNVEAKLRREQVDINAKSTDLFPSDTERVITKTTSDDGEIGITESVAQQMTQQQTNDSYTGESTNVGLTNQDLADAGLSPEEIRSIDDSAGTNLRSRERTRSRIIERHIDDDLRLREEHDRLHRED